ncbi:hypothetical protein BN946_scf185007.g98 [Trametes cinnabarina]|uniref:Methyltransferase domain-containing protein n=1 Tax=Pycnoporus cinnabarinus TaxID=5643 RepID=A0A060SLE1_PYCCI|nr:hypothetical protein BN946_scf185007.g98 [Trametes cinnabarina]
MSPAIYSPVSPTGSLFGSSFDGIPYSPSSESLCPLLPPEEMGHPSLFDSYISEMMEKDMQRLGMASTSDLSSPRSSTDSEAPLTSSPSQNTITQETIRPRKVKKKRSLGQALKALKSSQSSHDGSKAIKRVPFPLQLDDTSFTTVASEDMPGSVGVRREEEDGFDDRNRTVRRRNMPHHPFCYEDVPYMQAYSHILLEKLAPVDSPTFHNFGKKPPAEVLDLGCGEGFWVLHAAKMWKSHHTKVTGLDLIDMHNNNAGEVHPQLEPAYTSKNVTWFRANFVKYELPFPDDSFDLVRMANLTLCIPINRWRFVLAQVRRVLKPGGRLELIDDDVFFPSIPPHPRMAREAPPNPPPKDPPSPPPKDAPALPPKFRTHRAPTSSNVARPDMPFMPRATTFSRSATQRYLHNDPRYCTGNPGHSKTRHLRSASEIDYSTNAAVASHLETIFDNMLVARGISPHPHAFLDHMLREVFGPDCARQTQNLELAVPTREALERANAAAAARERAQSLPQSGPIGRRSEDSEKGRPPWMHIEWDSKDKQRKSEKAGTNSVRLERKSEDSALQPRVFDAISPKARQLLFGDDRTQAVQNLGPYQPPGLLLLPSTYIPCSPLELEMHACKHMNTLLGCKYALSTYMTSQRAADGTPLVSDREVDDFLWDYEWCVILGRLPMSDELTGVSTSFRRKRFNWPQDIAGLQMEDTPEPAPPSRPTLFRFGSTAPSPVEATRSQSSASVQAYGGINATKGTSTHVRTIRVYEAMKVVVPRCGCGRVVCQC